MSLRSSVTVFAPATVANVACGFDLLGFALDAPGDEITARFSTTAHTSDALRPEASQPEANQPAASQPETSQPGTNVSEASQLGKKKPDLSRSVVISAIHNDGGRLPMEPERNTAGKAVIALLEDFAKRDADFRRTNLNVLPTVELEITKKMPFGSGLGSSAASAVAAVTAVNELLGSPYKKPDLLPFALEGEAVASGAKHGDNVAPSLLGGFVMVSSEDPEFYAKIPFPESLIAIVIYPHIEIKTKDSRRVLPTSVAFRDAVLQTEYMAGLITGLTTGDPELIRRSLHDRLAEPYRASLIPGYSEMKHAAMQAGALGCSISGSGPSVFALTNDRTRAESIGSAMIQVMTSKQIPADRYISAINKNGAVCTNMVP